MFSNKSVSIHSYVEGEISIIKAQLDELTESYLHSKDNAELLKCRASKITGHSNIEDKERASLLEVQKHNEERMKVAMSMMRGLTARMEQMHKAEKERLTRERQDVGKYMAFRAQCLRQYKDIQIKKEPEDN